MPKNTKGKENRPDPKKAAILLMYALAYARSPEGKAAIKKAKEDKAIK